MLENCSGIYKITYNDKCLYVGQSINLKSRRGSHLRRLRKGNHYNIYLQRLYNKYGDYFIFDIVEKCPPSLLTQREMFWVSKLKPICNMQIPSDSTYFTVSEESRKKMSRISKARMTPEMKKKISEKTKEAMSRPDVRKNFIDGQNNKKNKTPWNKGLKGVTKAPNRKAVYCKELNKYFESAYAAGLFLGSINGKGVSRACLGGRKTYKGMHFKYVN